MNKKLISLLAMVSLALSLQSQTTSGTRFWIGFGENIDLLFNGDPSFSIIAAADGAFSGTVSVPQTGLTIDFSSDGGVIEVPLPDAIWYAEADQTPVNKGILVETDIPVELSAIHYRVYFSDGSRILPENTIADEYMVVAVDDTNDIGDSQVVIVGTADNTQVEITPSVLTSELSPAGIPFTVALNAGQIYQIKSAANLSGTIIRSVNGEKLAVFSGAAQAAVGCTGEDSHHWEQLLPRSLCEQQYPLVPYLSQGTNDFRVVAFEDDTEILVNCNPEATLNAGESYVLSLNAPALLAANKDVTVAQLAYSSDCSPGNAGSSFSILHPLRLRSGGLGFRFSSAVGDQGAYFNSHSVTIVKSASEDAPVLLNEVELTFTAFPENQALEFTQVSSAAGNQQLTTTGSFWATAASFGPFDACTYALGFDTLVTATTGPELFATGPPISDELCSGVPVDFDFLFENDLADPEWDFGDGSTPANEASPSHIYDNSGTYTVTFSGFDGNCPVSSTIIVEILDCGTFVQEPTFSLISLQQIGTRLFRLVGEVSHNAHWALYDLSGKQIKADEHTFLPALLNFNELPVGVYLFVATNGSQMTRVKINLTSR